MIRVRFQKGLREYDLSWALPIPREGERVHLSQDGTTDPEAELMVGYVQNIWWYFNLSDGSATVYVRLAD
jgi:hypothetical protein